MRRRIFARIQVSNLVFQPGQNLPGGIGAAVIHHHNFVRDILQAQFQMQMLDGRSNTTLFIPGGDYHGQQFHW
jgi:hypothetical protein